MNHSQTDHQHCAWDGCTAKGTFRAPKSRLSIDSNKPEDYLYLCENHITPYNKSWDYFEGMSEADIIAFQQDALHGHRPTWERDKIFEYTPNREEALRHAFASFQGAGPSHKPKEPTVTRTPQERTALATLDLPDDATRQDVKQRYKTLVKTLHPDVNNGDKHSEERFKKVTQAYQIIKNI